MGSGLSRPVCRAVCSRANCLVVSFRRDSIMLSCTGSNRSVLSLWRRLFWTFLPACVLILSAGGCADLSNWWHNGMKVGPDYCPFHTALATGEPSSSTLRSGENHFFQVHAAPVDEGEEWGCRCSCARCAPQHSRLHGASRRSE
jgi:hypothetical protein